MVRMLITQFLVEDMDTILKDMALTPWMSPPQTGVWRGAEVFWPRKTVSPTYGWVRNRLRTGQTDKKVLNMLMISGGILTRSTGQEDEQHQC